jgi:cytochrome P450
VTGSRFSKRLERFDPYDSEFVENYYEVCSELISGLLDRRRGEPRRNDVVDALLHETVGGRPLDEDMILNCLLLLITAGLDTTAHGVGHMVIRLARDPELRQRLEVDPAIRSRAIEEFLRLEPPAGGLVRTAMRDMVIGGKHIQAGKRVLLLVSAANRDPEEFDLPDEVNLERATNRHLAFGYGARHCLGIHLARLELRVALGEILTRLKDLRLTDDHIEYDNGVLRGPAHVNVAFTPGPRLSIMT